MNLFKNLIVLGPLVYAADYWLIDRIQSDIFCLVQ